MEAITVGSPAPDVPLLRGDGSAVRVRDLSADEPTVLFFLRHYG